MLSSLAVRTRTASTLIFLGVVSACEPVPWEPDATIVAQPLEGPGVARRATWRYWQGGDPGAGWREPGFDDRAWERVGAPHPASKSGVTYARAEFTLDDAATARGMFGEVMYNGGFVVYLNGQRLGGAAGRATGQRYEGFDWSDAVDALVDGVNVIAVEIPRADASSFDLGFDLSLDFDLSLVLVRGPAREVAAPPPPRMKREPRRAPRVAARDRALVSVH